MNSDDGDDGFRIDVGHSERRVRHDRRRVPGRRHDGSISLEPPGFQSRGAGIESRQPENEGFVLVIADSTSPRARR